MVNFDNLQSTWRIRIMKAGLKQVQFAKILDITPSNLCMLLDGKSKAGTKRIEQIEKILAEHDQPFKPEYIEDGQ